MRKIGQLVKVWTLMAVLVIAIMGMMPGTGQASEEVDGGFCPTSTIDSCGVNPETGTYFKKQSAS